MRRSFLLLASMIAALCVHAAGFVVTPYVQHPAADGMTVLFFTDGEGGATVEAWPSEGLSAPVAVAATVRRETTKGVWAQALTNNLHCGDTKRGDIRLYRHRARFEGLESGTQYDYKVTLADGTTYADSFRTAPDRDTPVRFVAYADCETTGDPWANYVKDLAQMKKRRPDFIAIAGDLVARGGIQSYWDGFWKANAGEKGTIAGSIPMLVALGNHDLFDNGTTSNSGNYYYDLQGETGTERFLSYFEFNSNGVDFTAADVPAKHREEKDVSQLFHREDYGPVTLIFLDTNNGDDDDHDKDTNYLDPSRADSSHKAPGIERAKGGRHPDFNPGSPQYDWLTNQLADAQANARFTFVVNHHCPYSGGNHNRSWREGEDGSALPLRFLTETMIRYGVDGWLCGHDEILEHSVTNGWEILPNGERRSHTLSVYDLGGSGDTAPRGGPANGRNPIAYYSVSPKSGGAGFLEVDVNTNRSGRWTCSLTPVDATDGSYKALPDQTIIVEDRDRAADDVVYKEHSGGTVPSDWVPLERGESVSPDDIPAGATRIDLKVGERANLVKVASYNKARYWKVEGDKGFTVATVAFANGTAASDDSTLTCEVTITGVNPGVEHFTAYRSTNKNPTGADNDRWMETADFYVVVSEADDPGPDDPPPLVEETIVVMADQSVTRTLSSDEGCIWLFGGEQAFAYARAALNIGYSRKGSGDYPYASTRKVTGVTVTLAGVAAGEERILVARQGEDGVPVPMAIYTVKVTPREETPYENLCAAFAAGGGYALTCDVECPKEGLLELGEGRSLELDLNGYSILCHADGTIRNAGDLAIFDSTASDPFAVHVTFGRDEQGKGFALIRNRPGATLTVDGVWIEAGFIDATGDYEFGGGNTAVLAQGGLVSVTGGGHLGGLVGIDVTGSADVFIDGGAEVTADTWRSGELQLGTCVRFDAGDSSLTVADALLESEGWIVQTLGGSALEAAFSGAELRSSRASAPFELADGATVSFADSSYEDLTAATRISQVTALANANAALSIGTGCTLTVADAGVIGFLADGVTAEAVGPRTWRTVKAAGDEGEWAEISRKLGAETEFANEPEITFVAADAVPADGGLTMRVTVAVRDGNAVKTVDPDKVKAYFEATDDLADWVGGAIEINVMSVTRNADGTMEFTVRLADAPSQVFVRIRVR